MKVNNLSNKMFFSGVKTPEEEVKQNSSTNNFEFPNIDSKYYKANSPAFKGVSEVKKDDIFLAIPKIVDKKLAGIACTVFIDDTRKHEFTIPKEDCAKYLLGKDGELNSEYLTKYVQTYRDIVRKEIGADNDTISKSADIFKECVDDLNAKKNGEKSPERKILPDIPADKLAGFALTLSQMTMMNATDEKYNDRAMKETNALFDLSKTDDGYDFSNIEQKQKIISYYNGFAYNYPGIVAQEDTDLTISGLIEASKNKKGKIDLDFIEIASRFLCNIEGISYDFTADDVAKCADKLATLGDLKDENFAKYLFKVINEYAFQNENDLYCLELLINPETQKFDKEYADGIREKLEEACECIENFELDIDYDKPNLSWDIVRDYLEYSKGSNKTLTLTEFVSQNRYNYLD